MCASCGEEAAWNVVAATDIYSCGERSRLTLSGLCFLVQLSVLVTPVPTFGKSRIETFADKNDLIRCNMASVHIVSVYNINVCIV
jgi:hypothetical protein